MAAVSTVLLLLFHSQRSLRYLRAYAFAVDVRTRLALRQKNPLINEWLFYLSDQFFALMV